MDLFPGFPQIELGTEPYNFYAVVDEVVQKSVEVEDPWLVIDNGKIAYPETGFESREL